MIKLIGIAGAKGSGKDAAADRLVDKYQYQKISFADPLKAACKIIFHLSEAQLYGDRKEIVDARWNKTPREIMQTLGTEVVRNLGKDTWIKSAQIKIEKLHWEKTLGADHIDLNIVIPDVRFLNEAEFIKETGGLLVYINRETVLNKFSEHSSETELSTFNGFDFTINNNSSLADLYKSIDNIIASQKENENAYGRRKEKSTRSI
jgi:hypothetical protein